MNCASACPGDGTGLPPPFFVYSLKVEAVSQFLIWPLVTGAASRTIHVSSLLSEWACRQEEAHGRTQFHRISQDGDGTRRLPDLKGAGAAGLVRAEGRPQSGGARCRGLSQTRDGPSESRQKRLCWKRQADVQMHIIWQSVHI